MIAATLKKNGIDGVIATNTTIARDAVKHLPHGEETGGLSGTPVFEAEQPRDPPAARRARQRATRSSAWAA